MNELIYKYRRIILVVAILALLAIIGISAYFIITDKINSAIVNVTVLPSMAEVKVGEKKCKTFGECRMAPGEYEVTISSEGFVSQSFSFVAKEGRSEENTILLYLEPEEWNADWYEKNLNDHESLIMGEINYQDMTKEMNELLEKNPGIDSLPVKIDYYTSDQAKRVWYTIEAQVNDDGTGFYIIITDKSGGNYDNAIARLKTLGIDVDKYKIEYDDVSGGYKVYRAG